MVRSNVNALAFGVFLWASASLCLPVVHAMEPGEIARSIEQEDLVVAVTFNLGRKKFGKRSSARFAVVDDQLIINQKIVDFSFQRKKDVPDIRKRDIHQSFRVKLSDLSPVIDASDRLGKIGPALYWGYKTPAIVLRCRQGHCVQIERSERQTCISNCGTDGAKRKAFLNSRVSDTRHFIRIPVRDRGDLHRMAGLLVQLIGAHQDGREAPRK